MYYIVALVYVILSGSAPVEPITFGHHAAFASLEKCQAYLKSPEFATERDALSTSMRTTIEGKLAVPTDTASDADDPPDVAVAITASCQEDNRI